ncbi:hypothetical protein [Streptomyces sp. NPDC051098]|uniref:hypothetical protein n=1 Tax=Streptomyces sp. NPDC051098 TaxID=3155411 RepID=UPI00342423C0
MYRSREWILDRIRQDHRNNPELPVHVLATRNRVSQTTVAAALSLSEPAPAKSRPLGVPEPVRTAIDLMPLDEPSRSVDPVSCLPATDEDDHGYQPEDEAGGVL